MPISNQPVSYFKDLNYLFDEPLFKDTFLNHMVGYLNAEGGIIFLGCEEVDKGIVPANKKILEAHKDSW